MKSPDPVALQVATLQLWSSRKRSAKTFKSSLPSTIEAAYH